MGCGASDAAQQGYYIVGDDLVNELDEEEKEIIREIWDMNGQGKRAVQQCCTVGWKKLESKDYDRGKHRPPRQLKRGERTLRVAPQVLRIDKTTFEHICCIISHARGTPLQQARLLFHVMDRQNIQMLRRDELADAMMLIVGLRDVDKIGRLAQVADDIIDFVDDDNDAACSLEEFLNHQEYIFQMLDWMEALLHRPQDEWNEWRREQKQQRYRKSDADWDKRMKALGQQRAAEKQKEREKRIQQSGLVPKKAPAKGSAPTNVDVDDVLASDSPTMKLGASGGIGRKPPKTAWS